MKLTIRTRVALYVTVSFAVLIVALGIVLSELYSRYSVGAFDVTLQAAASSVANRLAETNFTGNTPDISEDINETVSDFENRIGLIRVVVFDSLDRRILAVGDDDSLVTLPGRGLHTSGQGIVKEGRYREAFSNFEMRDAQGTVVAAASFSPVKESVDRIRALVFIIVPITILIVGFGSAMIARRALRPLGLITSEIDRIGADKPLTPLRVPGTQDEIARVAISFNSLIERIKSLIESQRNFLMDASHELKTPLTVIQAEIEMLQMKPELSGEERENLSQLVNEVEYATKLATDLIYLSRLETSLANTSSQVALDRLVHETVTHQMPAAKKRSVALIVKQNDICVIDADREMLGRALSNIVENAIKYSSGGSSVSVSLTREENSNSAVITVEDTGTGIGQDELPRIFDRFYRTRFARSSDEKGSGLGLSIARRIIEEHHGKITLTSTLGVGTVVTISLPLK